jgi:hypothetical protein
MDVGGRRVAEIGHRPHIKLRQKGGGALGWRPLHFATFNGNCNLRRSSRIRIRQTTRNLVQAE